MGSLPSAAATETDDLQFCLDVVNTHMVKVVSRSVITARVRSTREGNVLTSVCPSIHPSVCPRGGYPYPIMLCNISQNAMRQWGGPGQVPPLGGYPDPPWGVPGPPWGVPRPPGGFLDPPGWGGYPDPPGGSGVRYPPGGVPSQVPPPSQDRRSTHYTAGGMPLAFTQEDFLVSTLFLQSVRYVISANKERIALQ